MANHPNRSLSDNRISIIKGMLLRGDAGQAIVACFGGELNPARIAEIKASFGPYKDGEEPLTTRSRPISAAKDDLPPRGPYPSPYEMLRNRAALKSIATSIKGLIEKAQITLAMIERNLDS